MRKKLFALVLTASLFALSLNVSAETLTSDLSPATSSENSEKSKNSPEDSEYVSEALITVGRYVTYPDAVSSNHTFVTDDGAYKSGTWMYVVPGKSIKFEIGNESGSKIKGAKKQATWTISGNSNFTVKNGRLKLDKKAKALSPEVSSNSLADHCILAAEYSGETIYLGLVAIEKTKYLGYIEDGKFKNTDSITGKVGSSFDLRNLNSMIAQDVIASYKVEKSGIVRNYLYFASLEQLAPGISMSKKSLRNAEVEYDETGSITRFKPTAKGKFKITYKLRDGSGKKFNVIFNAEE